MLRHLWKGLCDLIYPPNCILCKKYIPQIPPKASLCLPCLNTVEYNKPPFCRKCSRYLGHSSDQILCNDCQKTKPQFDQAWGVCLYNGTMRRLIHLFKYGNRTTLHHTLTKMMFDFINAYQLDMHRFDLVVPIPLSSTRLRERGYNQSQLLAEDIARQFLIEPIYGNLQRIRHTRNQALMGKRERWTNLKGAFRIKYPLLFSGKSILIVDDLLTTGATVSEAAHALKEAGAKTTEVLTLAIAQ